VTVKIAGVVGVLVMIGFWVHDWAIEKSLRTLPQRYQKE